MAIRNFCFIEGAPIKRTDGEALTFSWAKQLIEDTVRWFPKARVVCPSANGTRGRELVPLDSQLLEVTTLPSSAGRLRRYLVQIPFLWNVVGESDVVCVDIPNESGFLAALICAARRKSLVTQMLGEWDLVFRYGRPPGVSTCVKSTLAKLMTIATVRCSQLVFAQGSNFYLQFGKHNQAAFKSSMVHSTLTDIVFCPRPFAGFSSPVRLLSVTGLVPHKRADLMIEALHTLKSLGVAAEWWCAGDGAERANLEKMARRLSVDDSISFLGYVSLGKGLLSLYREADIFVHPSMSDGVPHGLLEAMANSLPVVTTSAGGISDIVRSGVDGVVVEPGDPQQLVDGIMCLLKNPALAGRVSASAYSRAREFHSEILSRRRRDLIEETFGKIDHDGTR